MPPNDEEDITYADFVHVTAIVHQSPKHTMIKQREGGRGATGRK
jgi:hypothetical protein